MSRSPFSRILIVCGALAFARDARAQAGDLDILSRTVPPIVMLQFDTSGSMKNVILPPKYLTDRGAGSPTKWFNKANDATNFPASLISTTWKTGTGSAENYHPTCQIFASTSTTQKSASLCYPNNTAGTGCLDDDQDDSDPQGGSATMRCWNMPGGCTNVPAGLTCTTAARARSKAPSGSTSQPYTIITLPDVSFTSTTDYPENYMWWILQEIYLGHTPVGFIPQDRNLAAKDAITQLVNNVNVTAQPPRVKFGLARYDSGSNGGYTA